MNTDVIEVTEIDEDSIRFENGNSSIPLDLCPMAEVGDLLVVKSSDGWIVSVEILFPVPFN